MVFQRKLSFSKVSEGGGGGGGEGPTFSGGGGPNAIHF